MQTTTTPYGLATHAEWHGLTPDDRRRYLAALNAVQRRAMAAIVAAATLQTVDLILRSWAWRGYLTEEERLAACAAAD